MKEKWTFNYMEKKPEIFMKFRFLIKMGRTDELLSMLTSNFNSKSKKLYSSVLENLQELTKKAEKPKEVFKYL